MTIQCLHVCKPSTYWNYHYEYICVSACLLRWSQSTWSNKRCIHSFTVLYWVENKWYLTFSTYTFFCFLHSAMLWCRWRRSQVHTYWVKKSTLIAIWVEIRPIGHPRLSLIKVLFLTNVSTLFKSEQKKRVVRIFPDIIINGNNKQLQWLNRLLFSTAVLHCKNVITISHVIMSVGRSREKAKSWLELECFLVTVWVRVVWAVDSRIIVRFWHLKCEAPSFSQGYSSFNDTALVLQHRSMIGTYTI